MSWMRVSFGDGCDGDVLETMFGGMRGYVVELTVADETFPACIDGVDYGVFGLEVVRYDEPRGMPIGNPFPVPFDDIEVLHIY